MPHLLREAVRVGGDAATGTCGLALARADEGCRAVTQLVTSSPAVVRVEEVGEQRAERAAHCKDTHRSSSNSLPHRLPGGRDRSNVQNDPFPGLQRARVVAARRREQDVAAELELQRIV